MSLASFMILKKAGYFLVSLVHWSLLGSLLKQDFWTCSSRAFSSHRQLSIILIALSSLSYLKLAMKTTISFFLWLLFWFFCLLVSPPPPFLGLSLLHALLLVLCMVKTDCLHSCNPNRKIYQLSICCVTNYSKI